MKPWSPPPLAAFTWNPSRSLVPPLEDHRGCGTPQAVLGPTARGAVALVRGQAVEDGCQGVDPDVPVCHVRRHAIPGRPLPSTRGRVRTGALTLTLLPTPRRPLCPVFAHRLYCRLAQLVTQQGVVHVGGEGNPDDGKGLSHG